MNGHTPGTWLVCDGPLDYQHRIYSSEVGYTVCDVVESRDAGLIAAAPELLEALKEMVCWYAKRETASMVAPGDGYDLLPIDFQDDEVQKAMRAIAAATGEKA